jgi:hypothetical protein
MGRPADGRTYHVKVPGDSWRRANGTIPVDQKNDGLNNRGWEFWHATDCPCSICGHTLQSECEAEQCDCCSSFCT